jgi:hypothetical protein
MFRRAYLGMYDRWLVPSATRHTRCAQAHKHVSPGRLSSYMFRRHVVTLPAFCFPSKSGDVTRAGISHMWLFEGIDLFQNPPGAVMLGPGASDEALGVGESSRRNPPVVVCMLQREEAPRK